MQVTASNAASIPPVSTFADQMRQKAAILADGSGASDDQKLDAYIAISRAMAQSASTGTGWFQESTQADRDAVNAVMDNSTMAKQIRAAGDAFNARGLRAPRDTNVMAAQLADLNSLSDFDQKMIFASTASLDQTGTLESWKASLQENADGRARQLQAETATAVTVTLSDEAKAALAKDANASAVITDPTKLRLVDMAGNPLPPEKIGTPGLHPLSPPGSPANPDYQNNLDRFTQLANVVLDETGAYSREEKLDAWNAQYRMAVTGQLMGLGPEVSQRLNDLARSSTYQDIESARVRLMNVQMDAFRRADAAGADQDAAVAQATLAHLNGLDDFERKLTFTSVNAPDMSGATRYTDFASWQQQLLVQAGLFAPLADEKRETASAIAKPYAAGAKVEAWA